MKYCWVILVCIYAVSCKHQVSEVKGLVQNETIAHKQIQHQETLLERFNPPKGYKRVSLSQGAFGSFLRNIKLKDKEAMVYLYDGSLKNRQDVHAAVLDISVGKRDLQQCADATMRLRAEYFYEQRKYDKISFNFTNGFKADYKNWRSGKRIKVRGNIVTWTNTGQKGTSRHSFNQYLTMVFSYAGTLSLAKEMSPVHISNVQIGDVFIKGGSPGHAVIVVDLAENDQGDLVFLLAQSYMPAQDIHILRNLEDSAYSPWYNAKGLEDLVTPEWTFSKHDLKRFK